MRALLRRPGLHNLAALTVIQGSNALVPLLIVPFALATVGATAYAQIAITEAISAFVLAAVLFSFDVDGVARIARLGPNATRNALGAVFGEVLIARLVVFAVIAPLTLLAYHLAGGSSPYLLALWCLIPLGHVFHAYWFYQATEQNLPPAAITLTSRIVTLALIYGLLGGPQDAALVPLAIGGPFVVAGLLSTAYIVVRLRIPVHGVRIAAVMRSLAGGKEIFAGNVAVSLYREMNVVILGIVGVPAAGISAYALVEKSIKMLQAVTRPLNQFFFPKVLRAIGDDDRPSSRVARVVARYTRPQILAVLGLIAIVPFLYLSAAQVFPRLRSLGDLPGVWTMAAIMAPAMPLGIANFMFGTAGLNALGQRRYLFLAILITGAASTMMCFAFGSVIGAVGAAVCFVCAEGLLLALVLLRYLRRPTATAETPAGLQKGRQ